MYKRRSYRNITIIPIFLLILSCPPSFAFLGGQESKVLEESAKREQQINEQDGELLKRPYLEYNAYNLRDPFEDLLMRKKEEIKKSSESEGENVTPPSLRVQGLVWGGKIHQAIIDNKVVKVGDVIEEAEIIEISKDGVTMLYKKRIFKLSSPASNDMAAGNEEVNQ